MAFAVIQEFPIEGSDRTTANYDRVQEALGTRENPPAGGLVHTAGFDEQAGVFRIFDVWESREQGERFLAEHVQPLIEQGPSAFPNPDSFTPPTRDLFYELHDVIT